MKLEAWLKEQVRYRQRETELLRKRAEVVEALQTSRAYQEPDALIECGPTDCPSVAPPPIDRYCLRAGAMFQKRTDLADAQRRQLHGHVRRADA